MYIKSTNVDVFPFHDNRGKHNNRLLTEQNLIKLAKHPLENESFVLSDSYSGASVPFEFILCGYHFSIKFNAETVLNNKNTGTITAIAYLNNDTGTLYGTDEDSRFTALQLVSEDQTPEAPVADASITDANFTEMSLLILNVDLAAEENKYVIPEESRRTIDGGVIE